VGHGLKTLERAGVIQELSADSPGTPMVGTRPQNLIAMDRKNIDCARTTEPTVSQLDLLRSNGPDGLRGRWPEAVADDPGGTFVTLVSNGAPA
jgi:hypothetical protein